MKTVINLGRGIEMIPEYLLDEDGYPTDEYLEFIKNYTNETMPIMDFVLKVLKVGWYFSDYGFILGRKYRGIRKLELHTCGWSGNEEIIWTIKRNMYLIHFQMRYVSWRTGGHFYFEVESE